MRKTQMNGTKRMTRGQMYAKRTAKLMARMARDGETEELAEVIAEIMEPEVMETIVEPEPAAEPAEEIAEAVEEILEAEGSVNSEETENGAASGDVSCEERIIALLEQILALMQPAGDSNCACNDPSRDEDPEDGDVAEALAEAITEAMTGTEASGGDPVEAMVAEAVEAAVEEAVAEDPDGTAALVGEVLESAMADPENGEDPISEVMEAEEDPDERDRTEDALRAALATFRPILKAMNPASRRQAVGRIAAGLKARDRKRGKGAGKAPGMDSYAMLRNAARRSAGASDVDLGRRIMEKRNANLKK